MTRNDILDMYIVIGLGLLAVAFYGMYDLRNMRLHRQNDLARLVDSIKSKLRKP